MLLFVLSKEILNNIPESHIRQTLCLSSWSYGEYFLQVSNYFSLLTLLLTKCLFSRVETSISGYCYQWICNWKMQGKIVLWKQFPSVCNKSLFCYKWCGYAYELLFFPISVLVINSYWFHLTLKQNCTASVLTNTDNKHLPVSKYFVVN